MRVVVTSDFPGMHEGKAVTFREGDVIEGEMAHWAVDNGHGHEIDERRSARREAPPAAPSSRETARREPRPDRRDTKKDTPPAGEGQ